MKNGYFHIVYDGPALANNEMDVKELAPALLAVAEALEETNRIFNQNKAEIAVNVKGTFKTGCFGIDLHVTQNFLHNLLNFFKEDDVVAGAVLLSYLGFGVNTLKALGPGLLQVLKWLKNRKITKIEFKDDQKARIYVDEDYIEIEKQILKLLESYKVRKALENAIVKPLEREGIDSFACTDRLPDEDTDDLFVITREEAKYFITPEPEDELIDEQEIETNLQAVSVAFLENNKWRFTDGTNTFFAEIQDKEFIKKVQENAISFAKDDILRVKLYIRQKLTTSGIKTEYIVKKVIKHRSAIRRIRLPME